MLASGLQFWWLAMTPSSARDTGVRVSMMLAMIPLQILVGAGLFFASRDFYPVYALCGRAVAWPGLLDQQIGGLLLWVNSSMMSAVGILLVLRRALALK